MSRPLLFRPAVEVDLVDAFSWYEGERANLGYEFLDDVVRTLRSISGSPERYPVVHYKTRRALLARFPYCIFYKVEAEQIAVLSCFHMARNPIIWKRRT